MVEKGTGLRSWPAVILVAMTVVMVCVVAVVVGECGVEACPVPSPLYRVYQQGGRANWPDAKRIHAVRILSTGLLQGSGSSMKDQLQIGGCTDVQVREILASWATF